MKVCKTDVFKNALDKWLSTITDEPQIPGYTANQRAESNNIRQMTTSTQRESRIMPSNPFQNEVPEVLLQGLSFEYYC